MTISRRQAISTGVGIAATSLLNASCSANSDSTVIVDCHAHIYGEDEQKYPTIENPYRPPKGTGAVSHLKKVMEANGVKYVTAIQTSTFYRWDNRFTVDSAAANRDFMVAVCTLNPDDSTSPSLLKRYVQGGSVRGMRSIPAASGRLDDPGVRALWRVAEENGIVINVLVSRDKRSEVERMVRDFPKLRIVIDHCFNLKSGTDYQATLADMLSLGKYPNVHAKLTFVATGSAESYPGRDMHSACLKIINEFGADRCVWGSDFPCELWCPKFSYAQHLKIFTQELGLSDADKKAVLGQTAMNLWFTRS